MNEPKQRTVPSCCLFQQFVYPLRTGFVVAQGQER
jgi:hypothetical protein